MKTILNVFNASNTKLGHRTKYTLNIFYVVSTIYIWTYLILAKYQEYDENWASVIHAFISSLIFFVIIFTLINVRRHFMIDNYYPTIIYFITSSPVTIGLVILNYGNTIGKLNF